MEYMEWTDDLSAGIEEIDRQHQELFQRVNAFMHALDEEEGPAELTRTIEFLREYVVRHFESEEDYMVENDYPGWVAHKEQHMEFATKFAKLRKRVGSDKPSTELLAQGKALLVDWYLRHIRQMDAALGEFWRKNLEAKFLRPTCDNHWCIRLQRLMCKSTIRGILEVKTYVFNMD